MEENYQRSGIRAWKTKGRYPSVCMTLFKNHRSWLLIQGALWWIKHWSVRSWYR